MVSQSELDIHEKIVLYQKLQSAHDKIMCEWSYDEYVTSTRDMWDSFVEIIGMPNHDWSRYPIQLHV